MTDVRPLVDRSFRSIINDLFDFRFQQMITPRIINILYLFLLTVGALAALSNIFGAFQFGAGTGLIAFLLAPIAWLIWAVVIRVGLEVFLSTIRIAQNTSALVTLLQQSQNSRVESRP